MWLTTTKPCATRCNGYWVRCFDSAESFLARFDPREVACLIADIRMDGMSGLELQDKLLERKSPLPIVFITGHGDVPMAVNTMKKGAMDFIQKPFNEEALATLVERMLGHARSAFADHQQTASRAPEQADRRRPGHQHQNGGGASRQHHGKAQRQHGGRSPENCARTNRDQSLSGSRSARPRPRVTVPRAF